MTIILPTLLFAEDALEPYYSARTMSFHYGKHHKTYVDNINKLIAGTELERKDVAEIILATANDPARVGFLNNAAQVWNHTFFWHSMKPGGGGKPKGDLAKAIDATFGGYDQFAEQFKAAAVGRFGSGWAWLVLDEGVLKIVTTPNAETPMVKRQTALITVDVWEHAYYLDYQNRRADYVQAFLEHLLNWDFAESNFTLAK